jgi:hypothetical protein
MGAATPDISLQLALETVPLFARLQNMYGVPSVPLPPTLPVT